MPRTWVLLVLLALALATSLVATPPVYQQALVPAYGGTYSATDDLLKQILAEVKGLRQDVQAIRGGAQAAPGLAILQQRCASCHSARNAEEKGAGFVLFEEDGSAAELSLAERRRIKRQVEQQKMPPGGGLSDTERKAIVDHVGAQQPPKESRK